MCNETCANGPLHRDECRFFQDRDFRFRPDILTQNGIGGLGRKLSRLRTSSNLVCITPLRMLLKKDTDRKSFALLNMLMDHENEEGCRVRDKQINLQLVNAAIMLQEASNKMDKFSQVVPKDFFPHSSHLSLRLADGAARIIRYNFFPIIAIRTHVSQ